MIFKASNQGKQCKFSFNKSTKQFYIDQQKIAIQLPIGLHRFVNYFYIYLNPNLSIVIHDNFYNEYTKLLENNQIKYLKVPDKATQILAQEQRIQNQQFSMEGNVLVHCGSYNYIQDCFIVIKGKFIQVRNKNGRILEQCNICNVQFNNQLKGIKLSANNLFYFWKNFEYLQAKTIIMTNKQIILSKQQNKQQMIEQQQQQQKQQQQQIDNQINVQIIQQEQHLQQNKIKERIYKEQQQVQISNQNKIQEQKQVQIDKIKENQRQIYRQNQLLIQNEKEMINQKQNLHQNINQKQNQKQNENQNQKIEQNVQQNQYQMQEQIQTKKEKIEQQPLQYSSQDEKQSGLKFPQNKKFIKKQQKSHRKSHRQSTIKKQNSKKLQEQTQTKTAIKNTETEKQNQNYITPQKIQFRDHQISQSHQQHQVSNSQANQSNFKPILQSILKNALKNYHQNQYKIQLCCLNGCDVLDIRSREGKQYLYYHQFNKQSQADGQAISRQLCQLTFKDEQGQIHQVKANKLAFDKQTNSAYYNDTQRGYLHCYNLTNSSQQIFHVKKPVLDMARHLNGSILGIHQNQIFQFQTHFKKKITVAKYKTVHNLSKISSVFGQFYYATASNDGYVRTYDLRTYQKALNKFTLPQGITSLQVSSNGDYILCRYGNKAQILSCVDKYNNSVFESRISKSDRKNAKKLIKGYQHLSHIQFIKGSQNQGDIIAIDDKNNCNLVVKNIQLSSSNKSYQLKYAGENMQYLGEADQWIVYGVDGKYYRQNILKK